LQVLEGFVNVDSHVVRCLTPAVLRQHVAVALVLGFVPLALALTLVALLTSLPTINCPRCARSVVKRRRAATSKKPTRQVARSLVTS